MHFPTEPQMTNLILDTVWPDRVPSRPGISLLDLLAFDIISQLLNPCDEEHLLDIVVP